MGRAQPAALEVQTQACNPITEYSSPFNLPQVTNYVRYYSKDVEGNIETTKSQQIRIDTDLEDKPIESLITVMNLGSDRKPIHLSYSINPNTNEIVVVFEPNPIPIDEFNSMMKIMVNYGVSGEYDITVTGVADGILRTASYTLTVV